MGLSADVSVDSAKADFLAAPGFGGGAAHSESSGPFARGGAVHSEHEGQRNAGGSAPDGMETVEAGEANRGHVGVQAPGSEGANEGDECMGDAIGEGEGGGGVKGLGQVEGVPSASGAHIAHAPQFKSRFSVSHSCSAP